MPLRKNNGVIEIFRLWNRDSPTGPWLKRTACQAGIRFWSFVYG